MASPARPKTTRDTLFDPHAYFRQHLKRGLHELRERQDSNSQEIEDVEQPQAFEEELEGPILRVNVVDPTSSASSVILPENGNGETSESKALYPILETTLRKEYQNTLRNVPCNNYRSGAEQTLQFLPIQLETTPAGTLQIPESGLDPSEWHTATACHLYLVSGCDMEQYRTQVKPSIQAFLSQIQTVPPTPYLIVLCTSESVVPFIVKRTGLKNLASRMIARRQKSTSSTASGESTEEEGASGPLPSLSKADKDILRRLSSDFGHVCTLPLSDNSVHQALEWSAFLSALGVALVQRFHTVCSAYDDFFKKTEKSWMVKESWALVYELYQQPAEAALQYQELRATLPDVRKVSLQHEEFLQSALRANVQDFRNRLKAMDIDAVTYELEHYLLIREIAQYFRLPDAMVTVLKRCLEFVQLVFEARVAQIQSSAQLTGTVEGTAKAHIWAMEMGMDVLMTMHDSIRTAPQARVFCDMIVFVRQRLVAAIQEKQPNFHPPAPQVPQALQQDSWPAWSVPTEESQPHDVSGNPDTGIDTLKSDSLIVDTLESKDNCDKVHTELAKLLSHHFQKCGRLRNAACLSLEVIDIDIANHRIREAANTLDKHATVYERDGWDECHFFLLYRLAWLQRQFEDPTTYIKTLAKCFAPQNAPEKARSILFTDLVAVASVLTKRKLLPEATLFQNRVELVSKDELLKDDGKMICCVCTIGEEIKIRNLVESRLPESIELDTVTIDLIPYKLYVTAQEDETEVSEIESTEALRLGHCTLNPGINEVIYSWLPRQQGQYIVSSLCLGWKSLEFAYLTQNMSTPIIRMDVTPCSPSQSLSMSPDYILPGHEQAIDFILETGDDLVCSGEMCLSGSLGVRLALPSKPENWERHLTIPIVDKIGGKSKKIVPILVKSTIQKDFGTMASVTVECKTRFTKDVPSDVQPSEEMKLTEDMLLDCALTSKVTTLKKRPFTVVSVSASAYSYDRAILNAVLRSNAPTDSKYVIKKWSLELPDCLTLQNDHSVCLADQSLSTDEEGAFAFECSFTDVWDDITAALSIDFDNGHGAVFTDVYQLRLPPLNEQPLPVANQSALPITIEVPDTCIVGTPIEIKLTVDSQAKLPLRYQLQSHYLLLAGTTQGVLTEPSVTLMAIVKGPGRWSRYLSVYLSNMDKTSKIPTQVTMNELRARDPEVHYAYAYKEREESV